MSHDEDDVIDVLARAADERRKAERRESDRLGYLASTPPTNIELNRLIKAKLGRTHADEEEAATFKRSWQAVDLTSVLDGSWQSPMPTIGLRNDGKGLFYPGKVHTIASETEGGKTWLALLVVAEQLRAGAHVLYIDFEDDQGSIVARLRALQVADKVIAKLFHYVRPETPLGSGLHRDDLRSILELRPTFAVLDGVTAGMALHGFDPLNNRDVADFSKLLPDAIAQSGPAVVCLDHVTKSNEGRGRYAIGAAHKINGLTGAAYLLDSRVAFGIGRTGRSTIRVAKDRPGQVRRHGLPSREGTYWIGDLVLTGNDAAFVEAEIEPPEERADDWQPTHLMGRISKLLAGAPDGLSQRTIEQAIGGKAEHVRRARAQLTALGHVTDETPYELIKPFPTEPS